MAVSTLGLIGAGAASGVGGALTSWLTGRSSQEHAANLQFDNWKKQFDYEAAYNSPINQLRRASKAGVNPFVSPSGSQMLQMASANGLPNASAPSAFPTEGFGSSFSQIMQGLLAAQMTKGEGIKNSKLSDLLDSTIREKLSNANRSDALTALDNYQYDLQVQFGKKKEYAQIMKMMSEAFSTYTQAVLERDYGAAERLSNIFRNNSEGVLNKLKGQLTDEEIEKLRTLNKYLDEQLQSEIKLVKSEAGLNVEKQKTEGKQQLELGTRSIRNEAETDLAYAQSEEHREKAETERQQRADKIDQIKQDAEFLRKKNQFFSADFALKVAQTIGAGALSYAGYRKIRPILFSLKNNGPGSVNGAEKLAKWMKENGIDKDLSEEFVRGMRQNKKWQEMTPQERAEKYPYTNALVEAWKKKHVGGVR